MKKEIAKADTKLFKVLKSCKTLEHVEVAKVYVDLLLDRQLIHKDKYLFVGGVLAGMETVMTKGLK